MAQKKFLTVRDESLAYLEKEKPARLVLVEDLFDAIDWCVDVFEKHANSDQYAKICGLTLLKGKNLALGSLGLTLDGLGQEAGALMRPQIEYNELLTYYRKYPEKVSLVTSGELPKAGKVAKAIDGSYKEFRGYLNDHASHSSYSDYSIAHLIQPDKKGFRKLQEFVPKVLDKNFRDCSIHVYFLLYEGVVALERIDASEFQKLGAHVDDLHGRFIKVFDLPPPDNN